MAEGHEPRTTRGEYVRFVPIQTRWMDNDVYGHVNNVVYFSYFDTAVNGLLLDAGVLDLEHSDIVGLLVSNACTYFASVAFPDVLEVGVRVTKIGRSSVTYALAIFRAGEELAAAQGAYTHVYVTRADQRPAPIPEPVRRVLESLQRA